MVHVLSARLIGSNLVEDLIGHRVHRDTGHRVSPTHSWDIAPGVKADMHRHTHCQYQDHICAHNTPRINAQQYQRVVLTHACHRPCSRRNCRYCDSPSSSSGVSSCCCDLYMRVCGTLRTNAVMLMNLAGLTSIRIFFPKRYYLGSA